MTRSGSTTRRGSTATAPFDPAGLERLGPVESLDVGDRANLVAFFAILAEWSAAERMRAAGSENPPSTTRAPEVCR